MYQLTLNETQAQVIINALELYARVGMGQLEQLLEHPDIQKRILASEGVDFGTVRDKLDEIRADVFSEMLPHSYYSLTSPEIDEKNRIAYEILQVVRHRMAWDRLDGNAPSRLSVIYDEPMKTSQEPLPTILRVQP